ncbi:GMC oxidoreductase [Streptomyces sp. NPDC006197]|uniref:GMC family oxidoreductase n=1 Tax=Streptomyces sp. NPDC006197 TaxID=3156685 RepID=UPI0033A9D776
MDVGDNGLDEGQQAAFVDAYQVSASKNVPSPYASLPNNRLGHGASSGGTGDPVAMNRYYVETGPDLYKSGYQRMVGGSTWAWRGNTPRFLPNDFRLKTQYGVAVDWPLTYDQLESHYAAAEVELGVSGNGDQWTGLTLRSSDFPMPGIAAGYGDELVRTALKDIAPIDGTPVTVLTTPQARNSQGYQGRSACQGNSSCIPICPSGAKAGHPVGTMRMGTDRSTSVVDANGPSHAHPNLWIVGNAVFPTGSTANPTLTCAALSLRTADALAAAL